MAVYERAVHTVPRSQKLPMYNAYVAVVTKALGRAALRPIFDSALKELPDTELPDLCVRYARLEEHMAEVERARALYAYGSQYASPKVRPDFWTAWSEFEVENGTEDTFREMVRIKRAVAAMRATSGSTADAVADIQTSVAREKAKKESGDMEVDADSEEDEEPADMALDPMSELARNQGAAGGAAAIGGAAAVAPAAGMSAMDRLRAARAAAPAS